MGMAAMLVKWPNSFVQIFIPIKWPNYVLKKTKKNKFNFETWVTLAKVKE